MATKLEKLQKLAEETAKKKADIERTVYHDDFANAFKKVMDYVDSAVKEMKSDQRTFQRMLEEKINK